MATRRSSVGVHWNASGLASALLSAVLEWLLICLLFVDALFSYMVTKFAHFCDLQIPCLFCSRIDHTIGSEKPGFYWDLICHAHKLEISTLVYCCVHEKLSDAGGMCEGCISSVTADKKSENRACKSSMGKLDPYIEYSVDNDHNIHLKSPAIMDGESLYISFQGDDLLKDLLLKGPSLGSSSMGLRSCCNEPVTKPLPQRLPQTKSIKSTGLDVPSSGVVGHGCLDHQDGMRKRGENLFASTAGSYPRDRGSDSLAYVGYTELNITSDSESEVPILDDDRHGPICDTDDMKEELVPKCIRLETGITNGHISSGTTPSNLAPEKQIHDAPMSEPSVAVPLEKFHISKPHDATSLAFSATVSNGLLEFNCNQDEAKSNYLAASKPISSDKLSSSENVKEDLVEVTEEKRDVMGIGDVVFVSKTEKKEVSKQGQLVPNYLTVKTNQTENDAGPSVSGSMDLNDACKLAVGSKGNQSHATITELLSGKDSTSIKDDLKVLLSQISAVRGFELAWSDMSPRGEGHGDESKTLDISSAIGLQILPKRLLIGRHESGYESLDGNLLSEIEGESIIDRLKRQIELDRKSLNALYKELEEERSASAIAANQAMAMINRLQEEKAAMQMEALQYQRMMEEQSEYDQEALQKLNDLLGEREKEIQDLEEELETYRKKYPNNLKVDEILELVSDLKEGEMRAVCHGNNTNYKADKMDMQKYCFLGFEDEKLYILKCLKRLENKLHQFSNEYVQVDVCKIDSGKDCFGNGKSVDMTHSLSEDQNRPSFADCVTGNGGSPKLEFLLQGDVEEVYSSGSAEKSLCVLGQEILHLSKRLKTLEEDQNFLEHTVNSLQNGNEGLLFVQEIANHLQELRSFGMGKREQGVA